MSSPRAIFGKALEKLTDFVGSRRSTDTPPARGGGLGVYAGWLPDTGTFSLSDGLQPKFWSAAVSKALVTKQELALIALREIRSFPGGEFVTTAEVDHQVDSVNKTNWTLHVFTREGADMARIQFAITTTRKRLRHRYDLRPQS